MFVKACDIFQGTKIKSLKNRMFYPRIPVEYFPMESLPFANNVMPNGCDDFKYLFMLY